MRVPHSSQRRGGGVMEINMTPMIDMVFLLIVYFVWTSGDLAMETLLPSHISEQRGTNPSASDDVPPPEADFDPVIVRVSYDDAGAQWSVNGEPLASLAELRAVLANLVDIKRDAPVILHPEENVPLGSVIDVYDLSRALGFEKVQFATTRRK